MPYPRNRKILLATTPPTFAGARLCPLDQVPIGALKLVSFLKGLGNTVLYLDLHSSRPAPWKMKPTGRGGGGARLLYIMGRDAGYLRKKLKELDFVPDEIWLSCTFTFDIDLALEYAEAFHDRFPSAKLLMGGDAVRSPAELPLPGYIEVFRGRIPEADAAEPDFSVRRSWKYGLFSLSIGCMNRCAFCSIWKDRPQQLDAEAALGYVRGLYARCAPDHFWNWDPNVLMFSRGLERFLDGYAAAGIGAGLCFGKGFQPNLLTPALARKLVRAGLSSSTFPIESSTAGSKMLKPYTVISTIKALDAAREAGFDTRHAQTTFVLGYPDDDIASVFRSFSLSLSAGATPTPFPVFLFPGTADYARHRALAARKGPALLHGGLWPLLDDSRVEEYDRLLEFLGTRDVPSLRRNIGLLTAGMRDVFFREFERSARFVDLARGARRDSPAELARIEREVSRRRLSSAKNLLHVTASPRDAARSRTKLFAAHFVSKFLEQYPGASVTETDVFGEKIDFIREDFIDYAFHRKEYRQVPPAARELIDTAERFIRQIERCDAMLISTPMWTLSIPSPLKAYFELVSTLMFYRHRRTFRPRPVFALLTREGTYAGPSGDASKDAFINVQDKTLTAICGFLGLCREPYFIRAEKMRINEPLPPDLEAAVKASENITLRRALNL